MTMSLPDGSRHKSVFLPRRSLLVMTGMHPSSLVLTMNKRINDTLRRSAISLAACHSLQTIRLRGWETHQADRYMINPHRRLAGAVDDAVGNRVSFTFRKVRGHPCDCRFPQECDSQQLSLTKIIQSTTGTSILSVLIRDRCPSYSPSNLSLRVRSAQRDRRLQQYSSEVASDATQAVAQDRSFPRLLA